ncbi:MAG: tetratricopeptide repeat protein [Alloprevotella sp.]
MMRNSRLLCLLLWTACAFIALPAKAQVNADAAVRMGRNALSADDYIAAVRYFNQAIDAKPFLAAPYYYRAYAKFTLEDFVGAEKDCNLSIERNPFIADVYRLRAICRIHNENYEGAVSDYVRVIAEEPTDQGVRYNQALCFLQLKRYEQADSALQTLMTPPEVYVRAFSASAQSRLEQKDTAGAIIFVDKWLTYTPKDHDALSFKARHLFNKEDYAAADSFATLAIQQQPEDYSSHLLRAAIRHALGRFGDATKDYDEVIRLCPEHFVAHYNRGLLRSFTGDLNRAIDDFDFVLEKEPENVLARYNRAELRAAVGNYHGAIKDYSALLKAYPDFLYGYQQRALCRRKIGDIRGAQNDETVIARFELDMAFGKKRSTQKREVPRGSAHELDNYKAPVEEKEDTVRNIFGTLYGKVQNVKVNDRLLPMFSLAFRNAVTGNTTGWAYLPEVEKLAKQIATKTSVRRLSLATSATDSTLTVRKAPDFKASPDSVQNLVLQSVVAVEHYDFDTALEQSRKAHAAAPEALLPLLQYTHTLFLVSRSSASEGTSGEKSAAPRNQQLQLCQNLLRNACRTHPGNATLLYNLGCALAAGNATKEAMECFSKAIEKDPDLAEAYYNRGLLRLQSGDRTGAGEDFSRAGQLGIRQAYSQMKLMKSH